MLVVFIARMGVQYSLSFRFDHVIFSVSPYFLSGLLGAFHVIDHGQWIVLAHADTTTGLVKVAHQPGFVNKFQRHLCQLWHPFLDEAAFRIVVLGLLDRIVHAHGVYACGACLHLELWIMNARLVIQEQIRQMIDAGTPVLIKVMTEK